MAVRAIRSHEISAGHRVYGHENKCARAHGHGYVFTFEVEVDELDSIGRVLDFSVIKDRLCMFLEDAWDHRFLLWEQDPWVEAFKSLDPESVVVVPFNPTAENMALFLVNVVGPEKLEGTGCKLVKVTVEETRKCHATFEI